MRALRFAALLPLAASALLFAQPRELTLEGFLDRARQAGPEYFADIALRLIEARRIQSPEREKQLLYEVFETSAGARQFLPLRPARPLYSTERARVLVLAQRYRMERLTLQTRALQRLLLLGDAAKARELFKDLSLPPPARPACDEIFVPTAAAYFDVLFRLVQEPAAFSALERSRGIPRRLLEDSIRELRTSVDLGGIATALRRNLPQLDPDAFVIATLGSALSSINDTDRAFSYAVERGELVLHVTDLAEAARERQLPTAGLLDSLRGFLLRHYQSTRCADTIAPPDSFPRFAAQPELSRPYEIFNSRTVRLMPDPKPIFERDRQPARIDSVTPAYSPASQQKLLFFDTRIRALPRRNDPALRDQALYLLDTLAEWKSDDSMDPLEFFHQKATTLRRILQALPAGDVFRRGMNDWITVMLQSPARQQAPAEWVTQFDQLMLLVRPEPEPASAPPLLRGRPTAARSPSSPDPHPGAGVIVKALTESYDPLLSLYSQIEAIAPVPRNP